MKKYFLLICYMCSVVAYATPTIGGVEIFPANNVWNTPVDSLPAKRAIDIINDHGGHNVHPDFGTMYNGLFNGIPVNVVSGKTTPKVRVNIGSYWNESDKLPDGDQHTGLLPIPAQVLIENDPITASSWSKNADHHLLLIDSDTHILHELYSAIRQPDGSISTSWYGQWDLNSNALRPDFWTTGDAAGLPVTPGLVLYQQIKDCLAIDPTGSTCTLGHALRFTLDLTHGPHIWPARHDANSGGLNNPPLGLRVRLKSTVDTSNYSPTNRIILNTLKKYGAILADNGGDWYFQGAPDSHWNNDDLRILSQLVPSNVFEVVDTSHWIVDPNSAEANPKGGGYMPITWPKPNKILALDFKDEANNTTAKGFTKFPLMQYDAERGYGWQALTSLGTRNRAASSQDVLYQDFHNTETAIDATFLVDIPNGKYLVTLFYGDPEYLSNQGLTVYAEGVQVLSIKNTIAGQKAYSTFPVMISDGQLNLVFHTDVSGGISIAGLEIDPAPAPDEKSSANALTSPPP